MHLLQAPRSTYSQQSSRLQRHVRNRSNDNAVAPLTLPNFFKGFLPNSPTSPIFLPPVLCGIQIGNAAATYSKVSKPWLIVPDAIKQPLWNLLAGLIVFSIVSDYFRIQSPVFLERRWELDIIARYVSTRLTDISHQRTYRVTRDPSRGTSWILHQSSIRSAHLLVLL